MAQIIDAAGAVPQLDGTVRVHGLEAPVTIHRDRWGIPHVRAGSEADAFFGQGFVTAQDRLFQIECDRLRTYGRLAAVAGSAKLASDVFARRARLGDAVRAGYDALDAGTRDALTAWQAEVAALDALRDAMGLSGSNAWALAGMRTASGKPLLGGDPHRLLELPNVYVQIHLACPAFDVVGLAFPGVPGVPHFGQTAHVGWCVTNAQADYQDLFIERFRGDGDALMVQTAAGWEVAEVIPETIDVRGGSPQIVETVVTSHGPVVDWTAMVAAAMEAAAPEVSAGATWGARHRAMPQHALAGVSGALDAAVAVPMPELAGDLDCVCAAAGPTGLFDHVGMTSTARYVFDLGDRAGGGWIVPLGTSGHPASPHYSDQQAAWANGELLPIVTDWQQLARDAEATQRLEPAAA